MKGDFPVPFVESRSENFDQSQFVWSAVVLVWDSDFRGIV